MRQTTFVKKKMKQPLIPGTHPSINNGLLLVSTGIPALDDLLGGGLPVGTVFLVEEDIHSRFSKVMIKYFLAEGVMSKHGLFTASTNENLNLLMQNLPKPISSLKKQSDSTESSNMQIAFMYKNLPQHSTTLSNLSKYGHYYDISSCMNTDLIDKCQTKNVQLTEKHHNPFKYTLHTLRKFISDNSQYVPPNNLDSGEAVNILRVAIPNLAGPLWCESSEDDVKTITQFLHSLRALARNSMLVCMVTIPTHLFTSSQIAAFRHLVDCSVKLKAFVNEESLAFKQYHGMFEIVKLPCVNSLTFSTPKSFDLAFELKRTKFVISCFHLPPDLTETVSRQGMDEVKRNDCSSGNLKKNLDF